MYETYYNLTAKPFQPSPDPQLYFSSMGHELALEYLRYGISQGEGSIIITGDEGTGKSMLVSTLFQSLDNESVVAAQIVATQMESDDLLRTVAAAFFGLDFQHESKAALVQNLEAFFRSCTQEGRRVLIVVDEAQGLPHESIEELGMLSNLQADGRPLVQSFLLGQSELQSTIRLEEFEQLRQKVIGSYHLSPFGEHETQAYIEHRLRLCGWQDDPHFPEEVFSDIHELTQGVPRSINTLCDRLLLFGSRRELHEFNREAITFVAQEIIEEKGGISMTDPGSLWALEAANEVPTTEPVKEQRSAVVALGSRSPDAREDPRHPTGSQASSGDQRLSREKSNAPIDDSHRIGPDADAPVREHAGQEKISSSTNSSREAPMERTENLNKILKNLQSGSPDVEASALITEDGLIIASSLPRDLDEVTVGGMSATLLHLGTRAATTLNRGDVKEVIVRGDEGYGVMVSAGSGVLLLVVANENAKLGLIFFDMRAAINAIKQVL
jgi:putative secretion ATPase (PEP-CTERM system associated)